MIFERGTILFQILLLEILVQLLGEIETIFLSELYRSGNRRITFDGEETGFLFR